MRLPQIQIMLFITLTIWMGTLRSYGSDRERKLHISYPGIRINAERDYGYSPLIYSGIQGAFEIGYSNTKPKVSNYFVLKYSSGAISNSWGSTMQSQTAGIQTFKFYHGKKHAYSGLNIGWSNNNEFNTREVDNLKNFNYRNEYFTSFGPAIRYILPFKLFNREFKVEGIAHIQLLGFMMQSSYVTSLPPGFEEPSYSGLEAFLHSIDVFYPGKSWNFGIQPSLYYTLKSGNAFTIGYKYDYLHLRGAHITEKSRGTYYIGIITKL